LIAVLVLASAAGCSDGQGPSLDGPPTMTATVDGAAWLPNAGEVFGLLQSGTAFIAARRLSDGGQTEELIQIEFDTAEPFRSATYTLAGGPAAFAVFTVRTGPQTEAVYGTDPQHTGSLTIEAADAADSVVVGSFAFEAQQLGGTALRRIAGRFRVRYSMSVPLMRR
jgi:hypothetical protein